MDPDQTNIKLDVSKWRVRVDERSKNRMKLQIKLSKDEALAFKNFADVCKPADITDDDFIKTVFITGIESLNKQLAEMVQTYAVENKEELAASGITVFEDEDGDIKLAETARLEDELSGTPSFDVIKKDIKEQNDFVDERNAEIRKHVK